MAEETQCFLESSGTVQIPKKEPVASTVEAALGLSEKWDAREAGREVAKTAIQKLTRPPDFFLLFSTIHYEKHGGFQEFLNGVWEVLPKGTPLVGGTVVGFMNNYGCYTHGATALAVSCPDMDVTITQGKNVKKNPKNAVKQSVKLLNKEMMRSPYINKFLLNLVSGPETLKIPGQGYKKFIDSGYASKLVPLVFGMSQYLLQKGPGREDEIFEEIVKELPNYKMILGTSMDDYKWINNFQFINNNIVTNSLINIGLSTNLNVDVYTTHGMKPTEIKFTITKISKDGHIIYKINKQPAVPELLRILDWPTGFLNEKTMAHTILYYPISLKRHNHEVPAVMPVILKDALVMPCLVDKGEVTILTVSGNNLINAVKENLKNFETIQPEFGLISSCMTILQTLGYKVDIVRNEILTYFKEKPFVLFWCAGEGTYSPTKGSTYANMSFNTAVFGNPIK